MKKIALLVCLLAGWSAGAQEFRLRGPSRSARLLVAGATGSTLTLSSTLTSTATGSTNAIVLDWNARISWGGSGTYLTSTGAGDIRAPIGVSFTLVGGTFQADNMRSANGTGLTLKGSAINTSDNLIINSAGVALTTGDIMVWQNNGVEKAALDSTGALLIVGPASGDTAVQIPTGARIWTDGVTHARGIADGYLLGSWSVTDELSVTGSMAFTTYLQGTRKALSTCSGAAEGRMELDNASGASTGKRTKLCLCTSDGGGTPAYAWQNVATGTLGNTTTCGTE